MATKIRFSRGLKADLPILDVAEPAFTTDTKELYIGSNNGNILINSGGGQVEGAVRYDIAQELNNSEKILAQENIGITEKYATVEQLDEKVPVSLTNEGTGENFLNDKGLYVPVQSGGGIPDAPFDGNQYGRQDGNWTQIIGGGSSSNSLEIIDVNNIPSGIEYEPNGKKTPNKRYINFIDPLRSRTMGGGVYVPSGSADDYEIEFSDIINSGQGLPATGLFIRNSTASQNKINSIEELEQIYNTQGTDPFIDQGKFIYHRDNGIVGRYDISVKDYSMYFAQKYLWIDSGLTTVGMAGQLDVYEDSTGRYVEHLTTYNGDIYKRWLSVGENANDIFENYEWVLYSENAQNRTPNLLFEPIIPNGYVLQVVGQEPILTSNGTKMIPKTEFGPISVPAPTDVIRMGTIEQIGGEVNGYKEPYVVYVDFDSSVYTPEQGDPKDYNDDHFKYEEIVMASYSKILYENFEIVDNQFVGSNLIDNPENLNGQPFFMITDGNSILGYDNYTMDRDNSLFSGTETPYTMVSDGTGKKGTLFVTRFNDNVSDINIEELTSFESGAVIKYTRYYDINTKIMSSWS